MPILKGIKQKSQVLFTKCPTEGSITKYFYSIFYYMVKNIIFLNGTITRNLLKSYSHFLTRILPAQFLFCAYTKNK